MSYVIIQISESNCFFFDKFLMKEPLTTTFMLSMIILSINQSPCEQRFKIVFWNIVIECECNNWNTPNCMSTYFHQSNLYDFCIPFLTFSIGTLYTKLSMISLISEEKMIAKRRTNMTADTIIKVVSHMNQMEKNFWFNMFGGRTQRLL